MSAITAKASRKMKKYAVLTREPRCFLGSFDFSWEQRKFDEVFDCTVPNNTLSRAELSYDEGTVLNVHYGDVLIKYGSVLDVQKDDIPRIPHRCREDFNGALLQDGDVIIADTAEDETTGKACEIGNLQGSAIVSGLHTMVCRPRNRMALGYLGYYLNSNAYHHQLLPLMQGIKVLSLSRSNIQKTSVSYPIAVKEQQLIAYYFSQLDNLITLHQRKCANLCSPSQVVFSLLFATSTFSWEQRKLGEMGQTYTGLSGKTKDDFGHGQARFVTYMNVFSNPISNPEMTEPIEIDPKQNEVEVGDVFFTTSSETPEEVGMSSILLEKRGKTYLNSFCFGFRPSEKIDSYYLAYMLRSESTRAKIILLAQGISRYNISKNKVMEIAVSLPSLDEQKMIGQYFSQLDNLITLHQRECISFTGRADRLILTANKKRTTSSWEQRKLSEITDKVTEKNAGLQYVETFTNSAEFGIISQRDFFDHDIAKLGSLDGYYIVKNEDFVYNPRISTSAPVGPINRNKLGRTGVMSPLYTVFRPHDIDTTYLEYFFKCGYWHSFMNFNGDSGARSDRFSIRDNVFFQMPIPIPDIDEQRKIGELLTCLDNLITLHQRKPFLMKWRTSDANRNQTNRLVL
jgi:type I restriction enzyme S subunit